jgi:hypothetical protein
VVGDGVSRPPRPTSPAAGEPGGERDARDWRRLAWRAYEYLPRSADPLLRVATRAMLPFANRQVPLAVLRGPAASGGAGAVLVAGAAAYPTHRFFTGEPAREELGAVPLWRLAGELARRRPAVDLVVARLDRVSAALALDASYTAVPEWLGGLAPVPADIQALCRASKSLSHNLARMRRAGFQPLVAHDERDFLDFYDRMYVPFIRQRHGAESVVSNRSRLRRCFRQGGVLWVLQDGKRVAGVIVRNRRPTLDLVVLGTADGDLAAARAGAVFALDYFAFEHARALGCTAVDFGGSHPSPSDGLLLSKARWGVRMVASRTLFWDLCLSWERLTPPLLAFLARTPLIFRQADGLAALWATGDPRDGPCPEIGAAHAVLRSLRRLYVLGAADEAFAAPAGPPTIYVDPARHPAWRPPWQPLTAA